MNFQDIFGDKEVTTSTGTGNYKPMVPPTEKLADDTIQIIDFLKGVTVTDWKYDDAKSQLVVDFTDTSGGSARKYISDPATRGYITSKDEAKQKELSGYVYKEVSNLAQKFIYQNAILKAVKALGESFTFQKYCEAIGEAVLSGNDRTGQEVWLKLVFKDIQGESPKYIIANNYYIGNDGYPPKFQTEGDYADKLNFGYVQSLPDFSSQNDSIDDIFSTGTLNPGTLL